VGRSFGRVLIVEHYQLSGATWGRDQRVLVRGAIVFPPLSLRLAPSRMGRPPGFAQILTKRHRIGTSPRSLETQMDPEPIAGATAHCGHCGRRTPSSEPSIISRASACKCAVGPAREEERAAAGNLRSGAKLRRDLRAVGYARWARSHGCRPRAFSDDHDWRPSMDKLVEDIRCRTWRYERCSADSGSIA